LRAAIPVGLARLAFIEVVDGYALPIGVNT
jgi:hypothetical protein